MRDFIREIFGLPPPERPIEIVQFSPDFNLDEFPVHGVPTMTSSTYVRKSEPTSALILLSLLEKAIVGRARNEARFRKIQAQLESLHTDNRLRGVRYDILGHNRSSVFRISVVISDARQLGINIRGEIPNSKSCKSTQLTIVTKAQGANEERTNGSPVTKNQRFGLEIIRTTDRGFGIATPIAGPPITILCHVKDLFPNVSRFGTYSFQVGQRLSARIEMDGNSPRARDIQLIED